MKPAPFDYYKPHTVPEALSLLAEHGMTGKVIAGGQSLVPSMNFRLARPEALIDINEIAEIQGIDETGDTLIIGALTRHAAFHEPVCDGPTGRMLAHVVRNISHYPIRQRGTFGGSLSHADPASEWCLVAMTLGAEMEIRGPGGERRVPARDFFKGTFMTAVGPDELLCRVHLPKLPDGWGAGFHEFSRRKGDFALAMSLAALRIEDGAVREARLGVGGVASHALRLAPIEAALVGKPATPEAFKAAAEAVRDLIDPTSDIHGSAVYRRDLAVAMVGRALIDAAIDAEADRI